MSELSTDVNNPEIPPQSPEPPAQKISIETFPPRMVWVFMAFTIFVFIGQMVTKYIFGVDIPLAYGIKHNEWILNGEWWRLITPMFLHADLIHLGMNMYFLYRLGPVLEKFYGPNKFTLFYFTTAFTGVVLDFVFSPNPALGASTAMFGIYGATFVLYHRNAKIFGVEKKGLMQSFFNFLMINILFGTMVNASIWGHAGGLIGGMMIAWFGGPIYGFNVTETHLEFYDTQKSHQYNFSVLLTFLSFCLLIAFRLISIRFF
jgi:rhomboid protease GluP